MTLEVFTTAQPEKWDAVARSFKGHDVYYLSGYVKAFQVHGDGEPHLFYYKDNNLRGLNVVMRRDISRHACFTGKIEDNTWFDFSTPYGYGGWLIEGDGDSSELFECYQSWCQKHNVVSEFVRYHPVLGNHVHSNSFYSVQALGKTIAMDLSSPEIIWSNFTSKNRNTVRKALKSGVEIYNGRYPEIFEEFREIYNATMDRDGADDYYYFTPDFYKTVMMELSHEAQVFYAELDGQVIAASIMLAANGKLNYHLSGSLREYNNLAPTNLLLYTAALWGCRNGCSTFHLGGGVGSSEDSLYKFKSAFYRGEPCEFYIGGKIFLHEKYEELVAMRDPSKIMNSGFFPKYRA